MTGEAGHKTFWGQWPGAPWKERVDDTVVGGTLLPNEGQQEDAERSGQGGEPEGHREMGEEMLHVHEGEESGRVHPGQGTEGKEIPMP